jgi:transcription elongation factor Elf1
MDLEDPPQFADIGITCPHCGRVETADFEVLNLDEVHAITCDACKRRFHLEIAECGRCGNETVLGLSTTPTPAMIRQASCTRCGSRLIEHDDDFHTMGADQ